MKKTSFIYALIFFSLLLSLTAAGQEKREYYKYRDGSGAWHFSDDRNSIPEKYRGSVQSVEGEVSKYTDIIAGVDAAMLVEARKEVEEYENINQMIFKLLFKHKIAYIFIGEIFVALFVFFWSLVMFSRLSGCLYRWAARIGIFFFFLFALGLFNQFVMKTYVDDFMEDLYIQTKLMISDEKWEDEQMDTLKYLNEGAKKYREK